MKLQNLTTTSSNGIGQQLIDLEKSGLKETHRLSEV